ncbi:MFS transporter [Streptomyces sp. DSM 41527]|uniref:MFS transporter n=1 Tax=Streptomyces mooreae TaxID=3075523 RepID=A0ABU2T1N5_9ACTN|nr:MFS transporter [Streptomyces sp. DSM 41527]MDT0455002.1 MFS transporter [Streptomyces sp. DSM 41527]
MPTGRDSPRAWLAATGAMVAVCVAYGLAYSYGQFFSFIADSFGTGDGAGSAIFSITSLLFFGLGAVSGPLADRYGPRMLLVAGGVLLGLGLFLTAHASALWQAYVAYGLGTGLGVGCVYVPVMSAVGSWFDRRRALATGIVVSGVGVGTVVSSPLSAWMVDAFGWRRSYEYYALGGAVLLLLCAALVPRPPRHEPRPTVAPEPGRGRRGFGTLYLSALLINIVIYVPFVQLSQYARHHGVSGGAAASLVSVIGVSSIIGRTALGAVARRVGTLNLFKACHVAIAAGPLLWLASDGFDGLLAFALVLGVSYGGYIALIPVVLGDQYGLARLGRVLGVLYTAVGIGSAVGPAATGALIQETGSYAPALVTLAVLGSLGAATVMAYRGKDST